MKLPLLDRLPPQHRKRVIWIVGLLLAYTILGFLLLPPILKVVARKQIAQRLGRNVSIDRVRVNPYALSITIRKLNIQEQNGEPFVAWDRFYVNVSFLRSSFFKRVIAFDEIALDQLYLHGQINQDRSYNFSDILKRLKAQSAAETPKPAPTKPAKPMIIQIEKLAIARGKLAVNDLSRPEPFATVIGPIDIHLSDFSTSADNKNPYTFTAATEGRERFAYSGYFYLDPLRSGGDFSLRNISIAKYAPYYRDYLRLRVNDGTFDVTSTYRIEFSPTNTITYLTNAVIQIRSLKIAEAGVTNNAIDIDHVTASNTYLNTVAGIADIGLLETSRADIHLRRDKEGTINFARMFTPPPSARATTPPPPAPAPTSAPAFVTRVRRFALDQYTLHFEDLSNPRPVQVALDQIAIALTNFSTVPGTVMGVGISHRWGEGGSVKIDGSFSLSPVAAQADLDLEGIPLRPGDPYMEPFVRLLVTDGAMRAKGHFALALPEDGKLSIQYQGDFGIRHFASVDGERGEDFVKWSNFQLTKIDLKTDPLSVSVGEVLLADQSVHLAIWSNKTLNVASILRKEPSPGTTTTNAAPAPAAPAPAQAPAQPSPLPPIQVGAIVLTNNSFQFTDKSVHPSASFSMDHFGGTVSGISSESIGSAVVDLAGRVDGTAPFSIKGQISPLTKAKKTDLKIKFQNIDLTPTSPYTGKYIGNTVAKGKLSLDLQYLIDNRDVTARNVINLDQFTLGQKVESPDALKMPIGLAIALLKDVNGRIHIDVPVSGNLDDPKFKIGKLIWQTLANLVVKAATSPFNLIGSMFGGGGEELSYQEFAPGSSQLQTNELKKLDVLIKALVARPGLSLEIQGCIDEEKDREALRRQRLEAQLKTIKFQELRKAGQATTSAGEVSLTPEEYAKYLKAAYLDASLRGALAKPAPPAAPAPGTNAVQQQTIATNAPPPAATPSLVQSTKPWNEPGKTPPPAPRVGSTPSTGPTAAGPAAPTDELGAMERPLLDAIEIPVDDFRTLATDRAKRVQEFILQSGKVPADRIFLLEASPGMPPSKGARAVFNLR